MHLVRSLAGLHHQEQQKPSAARLAKDLVRSFAARSERGCANHITPSGANHAALAIALRTNELSDNGEASRSVRHEFTSVATSWGRCA
jgi:hypothetical protein